MQPHAQRAALRYVRPLKGHRWGTGPKKNARRANIPLWYILRENGGFFGTGSASASTGQESEASGSDEMSPQDMRGLREQQELMVAMQARLDALLVAEKALVNTKKYP